MKLKELLRVLRRHTVLLVVAALVGGLGGIGVSVLLPTTYSARTELFASVDTSGDPYEMQMASSFIQERMQTYVDMADSRPVLEPVIDRLDLDLSPDALAGQIEAYSDPRTVLITVEARADTPEASARLSRAVSDSLIAVIGGIENSSAEATGQIRLTVSNPPVAPAVPDGLALWMLIGLGVLTGSALGLGVALLRANLDSRLRSKDDLAAVTSAPVIASIPDDPRISEQPLITQVGLDSSRGEAFRRLRTNLGFAQVDDIDGAILITSAQAKEGKSSTSINLAIALAQAGKRVALIDVDLRQPTIAEKLGLENSAGLTTALLGAADVSELLQPWGQDELYILTAGMMPPNPAELLDSRAISTLLTRLKGEFDAVILDGPPLLPVADSLVLSKLVSRVLVVASVGQVRLGDLAEAVHSLEALKMPVNLVLNRVPRSSIELSGYCQPYPSRPQNRPPAIGEPPRSEPREEPIQHASGSQSAAAFDARPPRKPNDEPEIDPEAEAVEIETHVWPLALGAEASLTRRESLARVRRSS